MNADGFSTGYYGRVGFCGNKVHVALNGKPICKIPVPEHMRYIWCSSGIDVYMLECKRCRKRAQRLIQVKRAILGKE